MKWVAFALLVSAAAGVLTARAGSEKAIPLPGDFVRLVPPYPNAHFVAAGDDLHVDGAARFMAYAETDDTPQHVVQRYTDTLQARGLTVAHYPEGMVAVSPDDTWRRTILVTPHGRGSLIIASISHTQPNRAKAHLPIPSGCVVTESAGSHDVGVVRENVQLLCEGYSREVTGYYDALMGEPTLTIDNVATYERERETMTLVTTQQRTTDTPLVSAALHWEAR